MWSLSSSSDRRALDVVDGMGAFDGAGPHYSRRTPGSKTFTGIGREIVLVTDCGRAVWSVVYQRTPQRRGSGGSRGRAGDRDDAPMVWRNNVFRNLGAGLSSLLIESAVAATLAAWVTRYGGLPAEPLRTEIDTRAVRSTNPGYCYWVAGWRRGECHRGKLIMWAPSADEHGNQPATKALEATAKSLDDANAWPHVASTTRTT
jgi:hypothetical protein